MVRAGLINDNGKLSRFWRKFNALNPAPDNLGIAFEAGVSLKKVTVTRVF